MNKKIRSKVWQYLLLSTGTCRRATCPTSRSPRWRWTAWSSSTSRCGTRTWSRRRRCGPASRASRAGRRSGCPRRASRRSGCPRPATRSCCAGATPSCCRSTSPAPAPPPHRYPAAESPGKRRSDCANGPSDTSAALWTVLIELLTVLFEPFKDIFLWINKNDWIVFIDRVFVSLFWGGRESRRDRARSLNDVLILR